jgi:hypothetical protein
MLMKNILNRYCYSLQMHSFLLRQRLIPAISKPWTPSSGMAPLNAITGVGKVPRNMLYETNDNLNVDLFVRLSFYKKEPRLPFYLPYPESMTNAVSER